MESKRLIYKDEFGDTHTTNERINSKFVGDRTVREKLFEYEQEESEGKLIHLPCRVGDTVYSIKNYKINECGVTWIRIDTRTSITIRLMTKDYIFYDVSRKDFGKTVFLTREEAEKALNCSEKSDS